MTYIKMLVPRSTAAAYYKAGEVYEVSDSLALKFVDLVGIAVRVEAPPPVMATVQVVEVAKPTDLTEVFKIEAIDEAVVDAVIEVAAELQVEEASPLYKLKHCGGPWFDVISVFSEEAINIKPLSKKQAQDLIDDLTSIPS